LLSRVLYQGKGLEATLFSKSGGTSIWNPDLNRAKTGSTKTLAILGDTLFYRLHAFSSVLHATMERTKSQPEQITGIIRKKKTNTDLACLLSEPSFRIPDLPYLSFIGRAA
jgi:hypothetical protein